MAQGWKCPTGTNSYKKCQIQSADIVQSAHFLQYFVYCVCVCGTLNTKWPLIGMPRGLISSFTDEQRKYLCRTAHWTRWRTESGGYSTLGTCARPYTGQDGGLGVPAARGTCAGHYYKQDGGLGVPAARGTCAGHYNKQDGGLRVEEPCGEWKGLSAPFLSLSTPTPSISNTGSIHEEEGVIHKAGQQKRGSDEAMKRCNEALNASLLQFLCQR